MQGVCHQTDDRHEGQQAGSRSFNSQIRPLALGLYAGVAPELSEKSFCSTKGVYYFGVKLHAIAFCQKGEIPVPEYLGITSAAENDLDAVRHILPNIARVFPNLFRAYFGYFLAQNLRLCT